MLPPIAAGLLLEELNTVLLGAFRSLWLTGVKSVGVILLDGATSLKDKIHTVEERKQVSGIKFY